MTDLSTRFSLKGKVAVVTGASRGLGVTICETLSAAGADIVAIARDEALLDETRALVTAQGRTCLAIAADLLDARAAEQATARMRSEIGIPTILVNNAGMSIPKSLTEQSVAEWDSILNLNLRAPWLMARALVPGMIDAGGGKIINISSMASSVALTDHGPYVASKAGLNGLTKVMTAEWAPHNIQSNAVCPTVVWTPMGERVWGVGDKLQRFLEKIPAGRVATPQEVADLVLYLATPASGMINGQEIFVDGGYTAI
ncbi:MULTISPECIES: SDR family NAD(P)-dependent oxidoreductase [Asaia]|uniref:3-oxoacyl-[acyl-carrier protein] reductase n=1 Tax=Asaia bogorensis TaxID=91915 RepID=A0A060QLX0_9PROT|nr:MULTISPECIES: SDR family oxidoreductase [Asaia]ETC97117.1 short-chain dehydrogenase [Asaia sp. SF2.1]MDL2170435.1 SDR family oxidoreductase [Asaia sp. HumB]CDG41141.1 3-oxoacyl-[acyl-carrier protein] reductase [Asaia bogorensis]